IRQHLGDTEFVLSRHDGDVRLYRIDDAPAAASIELIELLSSGATLPAHGDWLRLEPASSQVDDVPEITLAALEVLCRDAAALARTYDLDTGFLSSATSQGYYGSLIPDLAANGYSPLPITLPIGDFAGRGKAPGYRDGSGDRLLENWQDWCDKQP